jgi:hypothetical protein
MENSVLEDKPRIKIHIVLPLPKKSVRNGTLSVSGGGCWNDDTQHPAQLIHHQ